MIAQSVDTTIEDISVACLTIPTDQPESDGTLEWSNTTIVIVRARGGGCEGIGYTYCDAAAVSLIKGRLADAILGLDALDVSKAWLAMIATVRNIGRPGLAACAISAVDIALWDLKAKLLDLPLYRLLGATRESIPVYGSGGFTSYSDERLAEQLGSFVAEGLRAVKMKVGREPARDVERVHIAREAIGADTALYVDANGAYDRKQAIAFTREFAGAGVSWFEEPVTSDDLQGLQMVRERAPADMRITAGEYGYDVFYFRRMLEASAVDILQADVTRCLGITGFLQAGAFCQAFNIPLSAHTAPALHLHVMCAVPNARDIEYFHDHVRIEAMLFDGITHPVDGLLRPDPSLPGLGLRLKEEQLVHFAAS